jgi:hypothetical protein
VAAVPAVATLSRDEARSLTDEVKNDAERLWRKLVELYEGCAHEVLGYDDWGSYFKAEFGGSRTRGYELLAAGRVLDTVRNSGLTLPANEAQANELAPLLKQPEQLREVWAEVVAENPDPTAADVREVVQMRLPPKPPSLASERDQHETMVRVWDGACRVLDDKAENAPAKVARLMEFDGPGPITPDRLEAVALFCRAAANTLKRGSN